MLLQPPITTRSATLFPYTMLFRTHLQRDLALEHQDAFHHRMGPEHDARLASAAELDRQPGRGLLVDLQPAAYVRVDADGDVRSEEHTSELQSLMRISYAVFCLKKKIKRKYQHSY